jgi:hypothetical protein
MAAISSMTRDELEEALRAKTQQCDIVQQHLELSESENQDLKEQLAAAVQAKDAQHALRLQQDDAMHHLRTQGEVALRAAQAATSQARIDELTAAHGALKAAHAANICDLKASHAATVTAQTATITAQTATITAHAATITDLRAQVSELRALSTQRYELVRPEARTAREFIIPYSGPFPPSAVLPPSTDVSPLPRIVGLGMFDPEWYAASIVGTTWQCDLNAPHYDVAHCTADDGRYLLTLRTDPPLPRDSAGTVVCRFVIEAYPPDQHATCYLGLIPSSATPTPMWGIPDLGGWELYLSPPGPHASRAGGTWAPMQPHQGRPLPPDGSAYATTAQVPKVPVGGAVEFAVDYAANTCRVAFYTPEGVAAGIRQSAPFAKMELHFNKPLPPDVTLYPATSFEVRGQKLRLQTR